MKVWGITSTELSDIVGWANTSYDHNVTISNYREQGTRVVTLNFVLRVKDSRGKGARRSGSGRRTVAACWHAHRDIMRLIFEQNPRARIKTAMADYNGVSQFNDQFEGTWFQNAGSLFAPAEFGSLCECAGGYTGPALARHDGVDLGRDAYQYGRDGDTVEASRKNTQAALDEWDEFIASIKVKPRMVKR